MPTLCDKYIFEKIPGTQIPIVHFCMKQKGHDGMCHAKGTFNGLPFELNVVGKEI